MKKIITLFIALVFLVSIASAQQGIHEPGTGLEDPALKEAGQGTGQGLADDTEDTTGDSEDMVISPGPQQTRTETQQGAESGETIRARNREMLQTGLENALTRVKNDNARQRLQQNLDKWMQKYQERMQRMEGVEITDVDEETGEATIRAKEPVRWFGFIKGKATKRFQMDSAGNINEKAPWYRFMYAEAAEETAEE
ncbi:hypothetical protein KY330_04160 [Candidatus Woesearchaeota archaeon]|nr:hypothetical protein [Candidatus Woesearchaeota archaeon]